MKGVDISHYQMGLTIRQIKDAGCGFAIIKVTEGTERKDDAAFDFYREAYESGFPVGCYCYSRALTPEDARSEAQFLLDTINGFPMPCGIFLDMEEPGQLGLAKEKLMAIVSAWCRAVREAGYVPGVYGSEYGIWAKLEPTALPNGCLVWVAHYGKEPQIPCDLWQSGDNGRIGGVTVDTDEARSERFKRMAERGFSSQPQPPEGETPLSGLLERLGAYIRTKEFERGFLDYIQRTEADDDE
ncbi:MAG: hypothetical protein IJ649_00510 [Oscillospiraceae bacterium]|nr:hypothetical protein [Oscillospiraceae bacterium]